MTGSRLIGLVVAVVVIVGGAYFLFPGIRAKIDDVYDKNAGWTDAARKKDPVGFIEYSIGKLDENIGKFDTVKVDLVAAKAKLEDMRRTNQEKHAFAEKQLGLMKTAYQDAKGGKGWPVTMAGKSYSEPELKSQVELLLAQKAGYEATLTQIDQGIKTAEQKQFELVVRINESKSKLELLKTQKELVKINQLNASTEKMMAEVNDVLIRNEAAEAGVNVRTVEELMKDASKEATARATPKADDFLNS
jgi:phage shock protein A